MHGSKDAKSRDQFHFARESNEAMLVKKSLRLDYESGGHSMVLMAPYMVGWTIPPELRSALHTRVNILLVTNKRDVNYNGRQGDNGSSNKDNSLKAEIVRILAANLDARARPHFVFSPKDLSRGKNYIYHIQIEMYGGGKKFIGHTHRFTTQLRAFAMDP
ncbi:hypothetical protein BCR41DRAFT_367412 [Lobosporangium transversale]|uniref:Uncharacterized protein n=1 Tax=Lobosporangium transversale TaxID=64571 RepID=A0A1Y2GZX5_9FUNG|nr:hypothetical protein BCR41DRAFT_367412 [Lobosporangium transversale]ORZ27857.1 hypothetical protein BCR41DRAFT_367412 [Lobosporangium transversale]|eukprot:XP_021885560.1 hypothetical protein BCR41DRAFT_367412 [Lobosporangium transversale]